MDKLTDWIKYHQIASFFLITFIITWGLMFPFVNLYFQEGSILAMIPLGWGIFGPALAGIIITRIISTDKDRTSRKPPILAFWVGLILSSVVMFGNTYLQAPMDWTAEILSIVGILSLVMAIPPAYVISSIFSRKRNMREFLGSVIIPRGSLIYYLLALLLPFFLYWVGALATDWLDLTTYYQPPSLTGWIGLQTLAVSFIYQFFYANVLGEEVGWRGFALPRIQTRWNPLIASLIIGVFWFPWHLPLKLGNPDFIPMLYYALSFIPTSIFLTWIYNRTKGSILAVGFAHIAGNLAGKSFFPITDGRLVVAFITVLILILLDKMWEPLPTDHPAVYRSPENAAQLK